MPGRRASCRAVRKHCDIRARREASPPPTGGCPAARGAARSNRSRIRTAVSEPTPACARGTTLLAGASRPRRLAARRARPTARDDVQRVRRRTASAEHGLDPRPRRTRWLRGARYSAAVRAADAAADSVRQRNWYDYRARTSNRAYPASAAFRRATARRSSARPRATACPRRSWLPSSASRPSMGGSQELPHDRRARHADVRLPAPRRLLPQGTRRVPAAGREQRLDPTAVRARTPARSASRSSCRGRSPVRRRLRRRRPHRSRRERDRRDRLGRELPGRARLAARPADPVRGGGRRGDRGYAWSRASRSGRRGPMR